MSLFKVKEEFRSSMRSSASTVRATRSTARVGNTSSARVQTTSNVRTSNVKGKRRSKVRKESKLKMKVKVDADGDNKSKIAPGNSLSVVNDNVVIPNSGSIEFGGGVSGKEVNAGKIRYGGWDGSALNIVGAGSATGNRSVRVWDKLRVGQLEFQEDGCIGYGPSKQFTLCLQEDGNIVQYKDKKPVWATGIPSQVK